MRVLAFDTAGPVVGVAFGDLVRTERVTRGAEGRLVPWAMELVGDQRVDAVAVAIGPGAFTGVRVGLATGQGLAHALGVPLVGIGSLVSRGHRANADLALLDARKGRLYAGYRADGFAPADLSVEDVLRDGRARGLLAPGFRCTGEGALVARTALEAAGGVIV
ncbi:MAG: tRNA (adenosine(37)-N6)-threonylcarbamoyltransferase complex dimerization subunit type 1 TsaB, partial [Myxococcales bacterium]|nr:tRNA (adenosine(37)-N6)-threonylcarbamoyltransferase complex dimerization subunit type 1 TsaB [Myxococcales bacterium]